MKKTSLVAAITLIGSSALLGCTVHAQTAVDAPPPPPPPPPGQVDVQVQAQAPAPADGQSTSGVEVDVAPAPEAAEPEEVVATSEPPEPIYEEQTDMPGAGMYWVPGYWAWSGADWAWYYGGWYAAPEGRVYVDPYYERVDDHIVYVHGYWGAQGEEPRYYGGDRIVFAAAVRPPGYVRGRRVVVTRSVGLRPGSRGHYGPRPTGAVRRRPLPRATAPRRPLPHGSQGRPPEHAEPSRGEPERGKPEERPEGRPEQKPEGRPEARPEARPAPKPAPRPAPRPHKK